MRSTAFLLLLLSSHLADALVAPSVDGLVRLRVARLTGASGVPEDRRAVLGLDGAEGGGQYVYEPNTGAVISQYDEVVGHVVSEDGRRLRGLQQQDADENAEVWVRWEPSYAEELLLKHIDLEQHARRASILLHKGGWRWPRALMPYTTSDLTDADNLRAYDQIEAAMNHWEAFSPLRFVDYDSSAHHSYINAAHATGACFSSMGRIGGPNTFGLDKDGACGVGAAIHEFGHALFLAHEQSRSDRDDYVTIDMDKVASGKGHNFDKSDADLYEDYGNYDFHSIMHYGATAFSTDGSNTITLDATKLAAFQATTDATNNVGLSSIGQRAGLSYLDRETVWENYGVCIDDPVPSECATLKVTTPEETAIEMTLASDLKNGYHYWEGTGSLSGVPTDRVLYNSDALGADMWLYDNNDVADDGLYPTAFWYKQSSHDYPPGSDVWQDYQGNAASVSFECVGASGEEDEFDWEMGEWGPCVCHPGSNCERSTRRRLVECRSGTGMCGADGDCPADTKPEEYVDCTASDVVTSCDFETSRCGLLGVMSASDGKHYYPAAHFARWRGDAPMASSGTLHLSGPTGDHTEADGSGTYFLADSRFFGDGDEMWAATHPIFPAPADGSTAEYYTDGDGVDCVVDGSYTVGDASGCTVSFWYHAWANSGYVGDMGQLHLDEVYHDGTYATLWSSTAGGEGDQDWHDASVTLDTQAAGVRLRWRVDSGDSWFNHFALDDIALSAKCNPSPLPVCDTVGIELSALAFHTPASDSATAAWASGSSVAASDFAPAVNGAVDDIKVVADWATNYVLPAGDWGSVSGSLGGTGWSLSLSGSLSASGVDVSVTATGDLSALSGGGTCWEGAISLEATHAGESIDAALPTGATIFLDRGAPVPLTATAVVLGNNVSDTHARGLAGETVLVSVFGQAEPDCSAWNSTVVVASGVGGGDVEQSAELVSDASTCAGADALSTDSDTLCWEATFAAEDLAEGALDSVITGIKTVDGFHAATTAPADMATADAPSLPLSGGAIDLTHPTLTSTTVTISGTFNDGEVTGVTGAGQLVERTDTTARTVTLSATKSEASMMMAMLVAVDATSDALALAEAGGLCTVPGFFYPSDATLHAASIADVECPEPVAAFNMTCTETGLGVECEADISTDAFSDATSDSGEAVVLVALMGMDISGRALNVKDISSTADGVLSFVTAAPETRLIDFEVTTAKYATLPAADLLALTPAAAMAAWASATSADAEYMNPDGLTIASMEGNMVYFELTAKEDGSAIDLPAAGSAACNAGASTGCMLLSLQESGDHVLSIDGAVVKCLLWNMHTNASMAVPFGLGLQAMWDMHTLLQDGSVLATFNMSIVADGATLDFLPVKLNMEPSVAAWYPTKAEGEWKPSPDTGILPGADPSDTSRRFEVGFVAFHWPGYHIDFAFDELLEDLAGSMDFDNADGDATGAVHGVSATTAPDGSSVLVVEVTPLLGSLSVAYDWSGLTAVGGASSAASTFKLGVVPGVWVFDGLGCGSEPISANDIGVFVVMPPNAYDVEASNASVGISLGHNLTAVTGIDDTNLLDFVELTNVVEDSIEIMQHEQLPGLFCISFMFAGAVRGSVQVVGDNTASTEPLVWGSVQHPVVTLQDGAQPTVSASVSGVDYEVKNGAVTGTISGPGAVIPAIVDSDTAANQAVSMVFALKFSEAVEPLDGFDVDTFGVYVLGDDGAATHVLEAVSGASLSVESGAGSGSPEDYMNVQLDLPSSYTGSPTLMVRLKGDEGFRFRPQVSDGGVLAQFKVGRKGCDKTGATNFEEDATLPAGNCVFPPEDVDESAGNELTLTGSGGAQAMKFSVPPGTLGEVATGTTLVVEEKDPEDPALAPPAADAEVVAPVVDISFSTTGGASKPTFEKPAKLSLAVAKGDGKPVDMRKTTLTAMYKHVETDPWTPVPGAKYNAATGTMSFDVDHLTIFTVVASPRLEEPDLGGSCDQKCSGHGSCVGQSQCSCWANWEGPTCADRKCPHAPSWGVSHDGNPHYYAECSNRGACNHETGECECVSGYTGAACERNECPNDCSGHGKCRMVDEMADGGVAQGWGGQHVQACVCDGGYIGADCSQRLCPKGDDPMTLCLPSPGDHVQRVTFTYMDTAVTAVEAGTDQTGLGFVDTYGEEWALQRAGDLWYTDAATGNTASDNIRQALLNVPNHVVPSVSVQADSSLYSSNSKSFLVTFTSPLNSGTVEDLVCPTVSGCTHAGCQPNFKQMHKSGVTGDVTGAFTVMDTSVVEFPAGYGPVAGQTDVEVTITWSLPAGGSLSYTVDTITLGGVLVSDSPFVGFRGFIGDVGASEQVNLAYGLMVTIDGTGVADTNTNTITYDMAHCSVTEETAVPSKTEDAECSNRGACNRVTGECECFDGFTGLACTAATILG